MNTNSIDQVLSDPILKDIKKKLSDAKALMPFLIVLSAKARKSKFKMSNKRFDFVSQTIDAAKIEPVIIPSWVELQSLQNDFTLSNQLYGVEQMLQSLLIEVKDTRMQLGAEALKSSTDIYHYARNAQDKVPGVKAIFETLKATYPGRGKNKNKKDDSAQ